MANEQARRLRKAMTQQEVKLWLYLRSLRECGYHFRRQVPRLGYVADFCCLRHRLVIEVDGGHHGSGRQQFRDIERDRKLTDIGGFKVLRFWNSDVDENLDGVLQTILTALENQEALRE